MTVDLSAHEETLNATIIEPLLQWYGIDGFRQGLVETQNKLSQGLLRNVREVEVMLIQAAKVEVRPSAAYGLLVNSTRAPKKRQPWNRHTLKLFQLFATAQCSRPLPLGATVTTRPTSTVCLQRLWSSTTGSNESHVREQSGLRLSILPLPIAAKRE